MLGEAYISKKAKIDLAFGGHRCGNFLPVRLLVDVVLRNAEHRVEGGINRDNETVNSDWPANLFALAAGEKPDRKVS